MQSCAICRVACHRFCSTMSLTTKFAHTGTCSTAARSSAHMANGRSLALSAHQALRMVPCRPKFLWTRKKRATEQERPRLLVWQDASRSMALRLGLTLAKLAGAWLGAKAWHALRSRVSRCLQPQVGQQHMTGLSCVLYLSKVTRSPRRRLSSVRAASLSPLQAMMAYWDSSFLVAACMTHSIICPNTLLLCGHISSGSYSTQSATTVFQGFVKCTRNVPVGCLHALADKTSFVQGSGSWDSSFQMAACL